MCQSQELERQTEFSGGGLQLLLTVAYAVC